MINDGCHMDFCGSHFFENYGFACEKAQAVL